MMRARRAWGPVRVVSVVIMVAVFAIELGAMPSQSLRDSNEALLQRIEEEHGLTSDQVSALRAVFASSRYIGQGNPAVTEHPATPQQCEAKLAELGVAYENPRFERICGAKYMAPLYDPATQQPEDATACIDMFEFPDIPCTYPVVWVRAREASPVRRARVGRGGCRRPGAAGLSFRSRGGSGPVFGGRAHGQRPQPGGER